MLQIPFGSTDNEQTLNSLFPSVLSPEAISPQLLRARARYNGKNDRFTNRNNLYIANLPHGVTRQALKERFSQFGEIDHVRGVNEKGIAFVRFASQSDALRAIILCAGKTWSRECPKPLVVKYALSDFKKKSKVKFRVKKDADEEQHFAVVNVVNPLTNDPVLALVEETSKTVQLLL